jgi:hypothetical protein
MEKYTLSIDINTARLTFHEKNKIGEGVDTQKIEINANTRIEMLQIGRSLVRFQMVSLEIFIDIILPIALWLWGRLSL